MIPQSPLEKVARAIETARCPGREGPYGGYDYSKGKSSTPYMVRDFRDPASPRWGCVVAAFATSEECDAEFERLTEEHIARASLTALLDPDEELLMEVFADGDDLAYREDFNAILQHILKGES